MFTLDVWLYEILVPLSRRLKHVWLVDVYVWFSRSLLYQAGMLFTILVSLVEKADFVSFGVCIGCLDDRDGASAKHVFILWIYMPLNKDRSFPYK